MTRGQIATDPMDLETYRTLRNQVPTIAIPILSNRLGISSATLYGRLQGARPVTREAVLAMERLLELIEETA